MATKPVPKHGKSPAKPKRRLVVWLASCAGLVVFGALAVFAVLALQQPAAEVDAAKPAAPAPDTGSSQIGSIVRQTPTERCEVMRFDNTTGRALDSSAGCNTSVQLDANGQPVPMGTIHTMSSISRSFSGH